MKHLPTALAVAALVGPAPALSQANYQMFVCEQREHIVDVLKQANNERQEARGIMVGSKGTVLIELFTAPDGGWTFLYSYPNGTSCVLAHGTNWMPVGPASPPVY